MFLVRSHPAGSNFLRSGKSRRGLALTGIILVVLNLRPAITSLSPIYDQIGQTISLTPTALGVLGTLAPLAFAVFGSLTPELMPKLGLEKSLLLALCLIFIGLVFRSFTHHVWLFGLTTAISLAGMGIGNVLLPPAIKSYFPDKIGLVTSIYAAVIAVSAALPSLVAVPVTKAFGWRVSTGMWALLAVIAAIPWLLLSSQGHNQALRQPPEPYHAWRWPTTWAVTMIFGVGALSLYTMIAWLPKILIDVAGVSQETSGTMMSMYNLIGLPHGLLVPYLLNRIRRPFDIITAGVACSVIGYLGLAYLPVYAWAWILLAGVGLLLIPAALTLINLRTRTENGAAILSGFTQGAGYLMGAVGPFVVGILHARTNSWTAALWFLLTLAGLALGAGVVATRPKYLEDQ